MLGKLSTIAITLFWLTMMGLLAQREIIPAWHAARESEQTAGYEYLKALAAEPRVAQMGIYWRDRHMGYVLSRVRKVDGVLLLENRTEINLGMSGNGASLFGVAAAGGALGTRFRARVVEGELTDFSLTVSSPPGTPAMVTVNGRPVGNILNLNIRRGDETRAESVPFNSRQLISAGFAQAFAMPDLHVGARWAVRTLDPVGYTVRTAWAEVVGTERLIIDKQEYDAYLVEISHGFFKVKIWADRNGEILKQKMLGFVFVREDPPADALERKRL